MKVVKGYKSEKVAQRNADGANADFIGNDLPQRCIVIKVENVGYLVKHPIIYGTHYFQGPGDSALVNVGDVDDFLKGLETGNYSHFLLNDD